MLRLFRLFLGLLRGPYALSAAERTEYLRVRDVLEATIEERRARIRELFEAVKRD